jgi:hypothetical protein
VQVWLKMRPVVLEPCSHSCGLPLLRLSMPLRRRVSGDLAA